MIENIDPPHHGLLQHLQLKLSLLQMKLQDINHSNNSNNSNNNNNDDYKVECEMLTTCEMILTIDELNQHAKQQR